MNDQIAMSERNGVADLIEQLQTLAQRRSMFTAVSSQREALDVFHYRVGSSIRSHAAVEQSRDARMFESGQDAAFGVKAFESVPQLHSAAT